MPAYCLYTNCEERQKPTNVLSFFQIPKDHRRPVWLKHAGIEKVKKLSSHSCICEKHFYENDIIKRALSKVLKSHAIPKSSPTICKCTEITIDNICSILMNLQWRKSDKPTSPKTKRRREEEDPQPVITDADASTSVQISSTTTLPPPPAPAIENDTKKEHILKISEHNLRHLLGQRYMDNYDDDLKPFILSQLFHKSKSFWKPEDRDSFYTLYNKNPSCYKAMYIAGFKMPPVSIISKWKQEIRLPTGFTTNASQVLREKAYKLTPFNRQCVLFFQEIAIKRELHYCSSNDIIIGFSDFGECGRSNIIASKAIVCTLKGLNQTWTQTVCYYIGTPSTDLLVQIIRKVITEIMKCEYTVLATICDPSPESFAAYKKLNPTGFPYMEIENNKIFLLFDHQELFKCIRNTLLVHDLIIGDEIISWEILVKSFKNDSEFLNITEQHLIPSNKTSLKLAREIFSYDVYSAIRKAIENGTFNDAREKQKAASTASFCNEMNDLFEYLNSGQLSTTNDNQQLLINTSKIIECIKRTRRLIGSWRSSNKMDRIPICFKALQLTLLGIDLMWGYLTNKKQKNLLLVNLHINPTENTLTNMRWHGYTYDQNFSALQLIEHLKKVILRHKISRPTDPLLVTDTTENVECKIEDYQIAINEDTRDLINESSLADIFLKFKLDCRREPLSYDQQDSSNADENDYYPHFPIPNETFVVTAVTYFAGFIGEKLRSKLNDCNECIQFMIDDKNLERRLNVIKQFKIYTKCLTKPPEFSELIIPTEDFIKFVRKTQQIFIAKIAEYQIDKNIITTWAPELMEELDFGTHTCVSVVHREIITKAMLTGILLYTLKNTNKNCS